MPSFEGPIAVAQGAAFAHSAVLVEILIRLAEANPNPKALLHDMFESVSVRMDKSIESDTEDGTMQFARQWIEVMFAGVDKALPNP